MTTFTIGNFNGLTFADSGLVNQSLQVYGVGGVITDVSVSLGGLRHSFSNDLDMVLSSPGQDGRTENFLFWSDVGRFGVQDGSSHTIADSGSSALPDSGTVNNDTFRPADYEAGESSVDFGIGGSFIFYRAPPTGPGQITATFAQAFGGDRANGAWTLRVRDDHVVGTGGLEFWSLAIETNFGIDIDGTAGADTIRVNLTGLGSGSYQMNSLPAIGFTGAGSFFQLSGEGGADTILASAANESITGGTARDTIRAGGGNDVIFIAPGEDVAGETYDCGAGRDTIAFEGSGSRTLNLRDDTLASIDALDLGRFSGVAGSTASVLLRAAQFGPGIAANAAITGTVANAEFGAIANASDRLDIVMETATSLNLSGLRIDGFSDPGDFVMVTGDGNNETILGSSVVDRIYGNGGNDTLDGSAGSDRLSGGTGNDRFYVDTAADVVVEAAGGGSDHVFASATYTLGSGVEVERLSSTNTIADFGSSLTGNAFGQRIDGNQAGDTITGLGGNDALYGYGGNDRLVGGTGNDTLVGGLGNDAFLFDTALNASTNLDTLADFRNVSDNNDLVLLENAVFTGLAGGSLTANRFKANATGTATDADDRIVYETDTGKLFYDSNGNGAGGSVQFAILAGRPALTVVDFLVL